MKIIITEQQANELLTSMLEDMFKGYEIKFEGDFRDVYVDGKLMAKLGPTTGIVSLDAYSELKDNLFFSSDKDLKKEVSNWIADKFGGKGGVFKYGVSFKKLHGEERDLPKKPKKPHPKTRQDKIEPDFNLKAFQKRTSDIETRLKNKEDLIRLAKQKNNPEIFQNWLKKQEQKDIDRTERQKQWIKLNKALEVMKNKEK
jgi:hypothetical protein